VTLKKTALAGCCAVFWVFIFLALFAAPTLATVTVLDSKSYAGAGANIPGNNGRGPGSRLDRRDAIVVYPEGYLSGSGFASLPQIQSQCISLRNDTASLDPNRGLNIFVPYKDTLEWTAFLDAVNGRGIGLSPAERIRQGVCCMTDVIDVCGAVVPPSLITPANRNTSLGDRVLATRDDPPGGPSGLLLGYGAQGDSKVLRAAEIQNNPAINRELTYVCIVDPADSARGKWERARDIGSCFPVDGACKPDYVGSPPTLPLPADPADWETELCAPGSILNLPGGSLQNAVIGSGSSYQWQCDGTPGRASATCSATLDACATLPALGLTETPSNLNSLCANGFAFASGSLTPASGTPVPPNRWRWSCTDNLATYSCSAAYDRRVNGQCLDIGVVDPPFPGVGVWTDRSGKCLDPDGQPVAATTDLNCSVNSCEYKCLGYFGGQEVQCSAPRNLTPECGPLGTSSLSGYAILSSPPQDKDPGLCLKGEPTPVRKGGTNAPPKASDSYWEWSCLGCCNSQARCFAINGSIPQEGQCGALSGELFFDDLPDPLPNPLYYLNGFTLCNVGDPIDVVVEPIPGDQGSTRLRWSCRGLNGGDNSICGAARFYPSYIGSRCGSLDRATAPNAQAIFQQQQTTGTALCRAPDDTASCPPGSAANPCPLTISDPNGNVLGQLPIRRFTQPERWEWDCTDARFPSLGKERCSVYDATQPINGSCGPANGWTYGRLSEMPELPSGATSNPDLCWSGNVTNYAPPQTIAAASAGPVTWTCAGLNGGGSVNCSYGYLAAIDGECGPANDTIVDTEAKFNALSDAELCNSQKAPRDKYYNSGDMNGYWVCPEGSFTGEDANCQTRAPNLPKDAVCASSVPNLRYDEQPEVNSLCQVGSGGQVSFGAPVPPTGGNRKSTATWTCDGVNGGNSAACSQQVNVPNAVSQPVNGPGQCGAIAGTTIPTPPNVSQCRQGLPTLAQQVGNRWRWTCGIDNVPCSANVCRECDPSATLSNYFFGGADPAARDKLQPILNNLVISPICTIAKARLVWSADAGLLEGSAAQASLNLQLVTGQNLSELLTFRQVNVPSGNLPYCTNCVAVAKNGSFNLSNTGLRVTDIKSGDCPAYNVGDFIPAASVGIQ
jgi:hypothetical protein